MHNARRGVLTMLTIVLLSGAAFAQSQATTGVIEGTVSDSLRRPCCQARRSR